MKKSPAPSKRTVPTPEPAREESRAETPARTSRSPAAQPSQKQLEDKQLVARARAGDQLAYNDLVRRHKHGVERLIRPLSGSVHVSHLNSPEQVVVGGRAAAIEDFASRVELAGFEGRRLPVPCPSQSLLNHRRVPSLAPAFSGPSDRVALGSAVRRVVGEFG